MKNSADKRAPDSSVSARLQPKHSLAIRWFHWINFPVLMLMIWSGILIYWANDVYRVGWGNVTLLKFFPPEFYARFHIAQRLAEGMAWHFALMWIFALNGLAYVCYLAFSGQWRALLPNKSTLREAVQVVLHDLKIRKTALPRAKFNGAQRIAYSGVIGMGFLSLLTGLAIYKPVQLAWISTPMGQIAQSSGFNASGYEVARWLHFWLTIGFIGFFFVHVAQVMRAGWNNFRAMITGHEIVLEPGAPTQTSPLRSDSKPEVAPHDS